jgi:hypothetical protein
MKRSLFLLALVCVALAAPARALVFKVGDTVYADGKEYTWEEWKKIRDHPELRQQAASAPAASMTPGTSTTPAAAGSSASAAPRAASCTTPIYYDEFPKDNEEFQCSAGLGTLTRGQILERGWKIDFIEKLPPPTGQPATSARGLPLSLYKLVISR